MSNGSTTVANQSDQVGRNLADHPVSLVYALVDNPVYGYRGPISTSGVESVRDGSFRKYRGAFRMEIGNDGWLWPLGDPYTTPANLAALRAAFAADGTVTAGNASGINDGAAALLVMAVAFAIWSAGPWLIVVVALKLLDTVAMGEQVASVAITLTAHPLERQQTG